MVIPTGKNSYTSKSKHVDIKLKINCWIN
uniref:Uncharacterized protein n=1 Tax=Anguilla anguilla TaxID=7936 RepID=A0A0E9QIN6_ANGAN